MKNLLISAGVAGFLAIGSAASATTLNLSTVGTAGTIPGFTQIFSPENNVLDALFGPNTTLDGYFGSTVEATQNQIFLVELFGYEAVADNVFTMGGNSVGDMPEVANDGIELVTTNDINAPIDAFLVNVAAGQLVFDFASYFTNGGAFAYGVANGSNPDGAPGQPGVGNPNFFVSFGPGNEAATTGNSLWIFYDDSGQEGDNHDDLVIRISAVPLPLGGLLLLSGLGVLALRRRA